MLDKEIKEYLLAISTLKLELSEKNKIIKNYENSKDKSSKYEKDLKFYI